MQVISSFAGDYYFLSNFYIEPDGSCVEKEFQASKSLNEQTRAAIMRCETPRQAKIMGRNIELRSDWEQVKIDIMHNLVENKFCEHRQLAQFLVAGTGDKYLIEGNTWHDNFWGDCMCSKCENIPGQNHLGVILMQVRDDLR